MMKLQTIGIELPQCIYTTLGLILLKLICKLEFI